MTQKEKAKAYDDALKVAVAVHKDEDKHLKATLERIFPELKESEDDKIRKGIKSVLKHYKESGEIVCPYPFVSIDEALAWLEKQGEQKPIINVPSREVILAIWDLGNEWKELTNGSISTEYGTQLYYIQKHWHESEYYLQKKQGEQKSAEWHKGDEQNLNACLGYIPDEYLRRWLMDVIHVKYDKPTDKVESKDYSSIDPHFGKPIDEMSANKVETKFHKGQWIVWQDECYKVSYNGCGYELVDKNGLSILLDYGTIDENAHLWDVAKDAKPGDVLYSQKHNLIWIYKDNKHYYASINLNYADAISSNGVIVVPSDVCPANRVQRSILLQKIEEAGYEWSDKDRKLISKKELKKVENVYEPDAFIEESYQQQADDLIDMVTEKSTWSEEDWNYIADLISYFDGSSLQHNTPDVISWLKSIKERYTWKPSDEQLDALQYVYRNFNPPLSDELGWNSLKTLELMCHDLKKLREE